jgi:hypothetical protein
MQWLTVFWLPSLVVGANDGAVVGGTSGVCALVVDALVAGAVVCANRLPSGIGTLVVGAVDGCWCLDQNSSPQLSVACTQWNFHGEPKAGTLPGCPLFRRSYVTELKR